MLRLILCLVPSLLVGQSFGCFESPELPGSGDAELNRERQIAFTAIEDPTRIAQIRGLPAKQLGGFAESYPARLLTLFAELKTRAESYHDSDTANLFLDIERRNGGHSYFELTGDFDFTGGIDRVRLAPATEDRTVPLIVLQTYGLYRAHASDEETSRFLLDLRRTEPRSLAALECSRISGGGACGAFDNTFDTKQSIACSWAPDRNDFLCAQETKHPLAWGEVGWKEAFYLLSGAEALLPRVEPETWRLASLGKGTTLEASRGNTGSLWPRFFLGTTGHRQELKPRILGGAPEPVRFDEPDRRGYLTGAPMSFAVQPLRPSPPGLQVFQVALTQDQHHSLFWIGVDCRRGPCTADVLWIATDGLEYDHCRRAHIPDSAARAEWIGRGDVLARLDVEPLRSLDSDGDGYYRKGPEDSPLPCPYDADLGWFDGGWVITRKPRPCDPAKIAVRAIGISSHGVISAAPAKMLDEEQW
jgi:hypothetical protein